MKIEIVSTQVIIPSSPTPTHLRNHKLSFLDERIPPSYIPLILYYNGHKNITQSEMCDRLKRSLSDALVRFYPLAGRMNGQISVDCNDQGMLYLEAKADGKISDIIRSMDSDHYDFLENLIPFKSNGCLTTALEQLAVQATSFSCGGMTIGICSSHRIGDASTLDSFIKCWAAIARGDQTDVASPVFNASTLFPPRNTPDYSPNFKCPPVQPLSIKTVMKRFVFTSSALNTLKSQVTQNSSVLKPTRVEVLTAFLWNRCLIAKGVDSFSVAYHPVSLRGKIPGVTRNSFGNIYQMVRAENVTGEKNWIILAEKIRDAFGKMDGEYFQELLGEKGFEVAKENFMGISKFLELGNVEVLRFSSFCRLGFYGADFGWGKPVWVSSGSYGGKDRIFLFDSVEWEGGIEAWVVLADQEMERLQQDLEFQHFTSSFAS
ncbi:hypothetical protein DH2020_013584 [Rehmannia glutinosa]|uniref:Uncharacterized protein n=1 Tax=Rehmannia glutinosa TaxID=99300 RepID=A0ABR0X6E6_REHGL